VSLPEPQRAVIILPSSGEFDSRTYRIARALVARGHDVRVIARWRPGLAPEERHPDGYRITRVEASAIDGLPFPRTVRRLRDLIRRRDAGGMEASERGAARSGPETRRSIFRRIGAWLVANLAIPLTIRSHRRRVRALGLGADLVHGMAYMGIPVALAVGRRSAARVVYDARDIYMDAGNLARLPRPIRWLVGRQERGWARHADRVVTVNDGYADVMAARWQVDRPLVVLNCSYRFVPPHPRERRFHGVLDLRPETRVVLYHGGFSRDRGIEQLMAAIPSVPDATLVLMGYGKLQAELEDRAGDPVLGGRVRLLPAVDPAELLAWVASADVVAIPIQPSTLNHRLTTPNKLFEALAAGVPVVAGDLPGMAPIVRSTNCGLLVDPADPAAIADALRSLLELADSDMASLRARCLAAAHETYNWERQAEILLAEYGRLTGRPW
jgi:glycosyltransferase involved in cell wall biosynthesis